jgi:hypothetical protein
MLDYTQLCEAVEDYYQYSVEAGHSPKTIKNKKETFQRLKKFLDGRCFDFNNARVHIQTLILDPIN